MQYTVHYVDDNIVLIPCYRQLEPVEALSALLNDPTVAVGYDTLVPCFDVSELSRRNLLMRKESRKCS